MFVLQFLKINRPAEVLQYMALLPSVAFFVNSFHIMEVPGSICHQTTSSTTASRRVFRRRSLRVPRDIAEEINEKFEVP